MSRENTSISEKPARRLQALPILTIARAQAQPPESKRIAIMVNASVTVGWVHGISCEESLAYMSDPAVCR